MYTQQSPETLESSAVAFSPDTNSQIISDEVRVDGGLSAHDQRVHALLDTNAQFVDVTTPDFISSALSTLRTIATERAKVTRNEGLIAKYGALVEQGGTTKKYEKQVTLLGKFTAKREAYSPIALASDTYYDARATSLHAYKQKTLSDEEKQAYLLDTLEAFDALQEATGFAQDLTSFLQAREYIILQHEAPKTLKAFKRLTTLALAHSGITLATGTVPEETASAPQIEHVPEEPTLERGSKDEQPFETRHIDQVGYPRTYKELYELRKKPVTNDAFFSDRENARQLAQLLEDGILRGEIQPDARGLLIRNNAVLSSLSRHDPEMVRDILCRHDAHITLEATNPDEHNMRTSSISIESPLLHAIPRRIRTVLNHWPRGGSFMLRRHLAKIAGNDLDESDEATA
jgi:hypothetical protein